MGLGNDAPTRLARPKRLMRFTRPKLSASKISWFGLCRSRRLFWALRDSFSFLNSGRRVYIILTETIGIEL